MCHRVAATIADFPGVAKEVLRLEHAALARDKAWEPQGTATLHANCRESRRHEGVYWATPEF